MASEIQHQQFIESFTERDMDLLVLEELQVSREFCDWFCARVYDRPIFKSIEGDRDGVWHSVSNEYGETDILIIFTSDDGTTMAILIENKIAAKPQPAQGERYRKRGEKGKDEGKWQDYRTCLLAPRKYLGSSLQTEEYDSEIAYEEIMAYFAARRSSELRYKYRANFFMGGVEQQRRGPQPKQTSGPLTDFVKQYWKFAQHRYPELQMREPKPRPAGNTWINFYPSGLSRHVELVHQLTAGFVKAIFQGKAASIEAFEARFSNMAGSFPGLEVKLAGKSVAIVVPVVRLDPLNQAFEACRDSASAAMDIAQRLAREIAARGTL